MYYGVEEPRGWVDAGMREREREEGGLYATVTDSPPAAEPSYVHQNSYSTSYSTSQSHSQSSSSSSSHSTSQSQPQDTPPPRPKLSRSDRQRLASEYRALRLKQRALMEGGLILPATALFFLLGAWALGYDGMTENISVIHLTRG